MQIFTKILLFALVTFVSGCIFVPVDDGRGGGDRGGDRGDDQHQHDRGRDRDHERDRDREH
jgi:hypothetical protein